MSEKQNNIILYNDSDGKVKVNVGSANEDVCPTKTQLTEYSR